MLTKNTRTNKQLWAAMAPHAAVASGLRTTSQIGGFPMQVRLAVLMAFTFAGFATSAQGEVIINAVEMDGDVVFTTEDGSLNSKAWDIQGDDQPRGGRLDPGDRILLGLGSPQVIVDEYFDPLSFTGPENFGTGTFAFFADAGTGDVFGLDFGPAKILLVPDEYVSGDPLDGSSTYVGETFASIGMKEGSYTWTWGFGDTLDSLTLNIGDGAGTCEEDLDLCEADLDICDVDLDICDGDLDICEVDLGDSELALLACLDSLEVATDLDRDGVREPGDRCPQTPLGDEVNDDGCSRSQFCEAVETNTPKAVRWCTTARWGDSSVLPSCRVRYVGWNRLCRAIRY
jgi:hypothetical protein